MDGTDWKREYEKERFRTQLERAEGARVEKQVAESEKRLAEAEKRAAEAKKRLAEAEKRAAEMKRARERIRAETQGGARVNRAQDETR